MLINQVLFISLYETREIILIEVNDESDLSNAFKNLYFDCFKPL